MFDITHICKSVFFFVYRLVFNGYKLLNSEKDTAIINAPECEELIFKDVESINIKLKNNCKFANKERQAAIETSVQEAIETLKLRRTLRRFKMDLFSHLISYLQAEKMITNEEIEKIDEINIIKSTSILAFLQPNIKVVSSELSSSGKEEIGILTLSEKYPQTITIEN